MSAIKLQHLRNGHIFAKQNYFLKRLGNIKAKIKLASLLILHLAFRILL